MDPHPLSGRLDELLAHREWVRRVARALVSDESRADDLEQETWLRAAREPAPRSPRAWLGTILRNTAVNMRLAQMRRDAHEDATPPSRDVPSPAQMLERAEVVEHVARAVRTLDEPYRTVVFLRYFEDMPPPAIAAHLGVPVETVRTRLRRGLALLRERLDADHGGDRRAWTLLLAPHTRRPVPASVASTVAAGAAGALAMTLTAKIGIAAVVFAAGGMMWWKRPEAPAAELAPTAPPVKEEAAPPAAAAPHVRVRTAPVSEVSAQKDEPIAGAAMTGRIVDEATHAPVAGAAVRLTYGMSRCEPPNAPTAVADAAGRFRIAGIADNDRYRHMLYVEAEGYASAAPSVNGWHEKIAGAEPVDLGEFALERGADVAGRVLTADGAPVANAAVLFCRNTPVTFPPTFCPDVSKEVARTDAEGRLRLTHVPSIARNHPHTLFAVADAGFGWLALPAVVGKKDLAGQDIRLARTASIEVIVRDKAGRAVPGAAVMAEPHFAPLGTPSTYPDSGHDMGIDSPELAPLFKGVTDDSGRLRLARLPVDGESCRYDVVVTADGFGMASKDRIRVSAESRVEAVIEMKPFRAASVSGTVRDAAGAPVADIEVQFAGVPKIRTDAAGAFRFEGLDPAMYVSGAWILIDSELYARWEKSFRFSAAGDSEPFAIVLDKAIPVRGRVVDEAGAPVPGTWVNICTGNGSNNGQNEQRKTGADGRFSLRAGTGRPNSLSFYPPDPQAAWLWPEPVNPPTDGSEMTVVLRRAPAGTRLVVDVVDLATGRPIDPANAQLQPVDWRKTPLTSRVPVMESGRVAFDGVIPGDWELWVFAADHSPVLTKLRVEPGREDMKVTVRLGTPGTVRGTLEGIPPGPRERRMVFLSIPGLSSKPQAVKLQANPRLIDAAYVEEDGTFKIEGVPPGRLRIWTEWESVRGETEVDVPSGGAVDAVVRLVPAVRATFRAAADAPKAVVLVRFAGTDGVWSTWCAFVTKDKTTTNVPVGRVRWQARFQDAHGAPIEDGAAAVEGEFDARAGEPPDVTIPAR